MRSAVQVVVDGQPLSTIGAYGDLGWSSRWPGGCWEASWGLNVQKGWRHPKLRRGAAVRIMYGGLPAWTGELGAFDWDTGQATASGLYRRSEHYKALVWDGADMVRTWDLAAAVDDAISPHSLSARTAIGWRRDTFTTGSLKTPGQEGEAVMWLVDLIDLAMARGHGTPYLGADGRLRMMTAPFTGPSGLPLWQVRPHVVDVGEAAGPGRATRLFVDYMVRTAIVWDAGTTYAIGNLVWWADHVWKSTVGGNNNHEPVEGSPFWTALGTPEPWSAQTTYDAGSFVTYSGSLWEATGAPVAGTAPPAAGWTNRGQMPYEDKISVQDADVTPYREESIDARALGPMSTAQATDVADQGLAEALAPAYTTDIEATPYTVTATHGAPINPLLLHAGMLGRINGAAHPRLGQPFIDVIAGEVIVSDALTSNPRAQIKPYGKTARGYIEVMEAALTAARKAAA